MFMRTGSAVQVHGEQQGLLKIWNQCCSHHNHDDPEENMQWLFDYLLIMSNFPVEFAISSLQRQRDDGTGIVSV